MFQQSRVESEITLGSTLGSVGAIFGRLELNPELLWTKSIVTPISTPECLEKSVMGSFLAL
jgi:hypothetical protein